MILKPPFSLSTVVQHFGDNAVSLYTQGLGLKGHPGIDFGVPWGTDIPCATDSYCYSTILNKDPAFYQCVYTIVDEPDVSYEISYGHLSTISVKPGTNLKVGYIIGNVGNTGSVYQGGTEVTESEKLSGSHAGSHLHFQVRLLKKVPNWEFDPAKNHINDGNGLYTTTDGYNYEIPEWNNGYNGCVNPDQFFSDMQDTIRAEVSVLNTTTDPSVRQSFIALIVSQIRKLLGI